jgi:hypothetical protein
MCSDAHRLAYPRGTVLVSIFVNPAYKEPTYYEPTSKEPTSTEPTSETPTSKKLKPLTNS